MNAHGRAAARRARQDVDTQEECKQMFEEMWPKALQELKRIAEQ